MAHIRHPWLASLAPYAEEAKKQWPGMRVSCCLAQAALETGYGRRPIGGWNLWGLKDLSWNPGKVLIWTHEWDANRKEMVPVQVAFEDFATAEEAFGAYGRLVTNSPTYADAREHTDLRLYVHALAHHWATDPQYARKVWVIIEKEGLRGLDP